MPSAIVLRTAGTNCDAEMVRAFELAGARTDLVHLDALIAEPARLDSYDLAGFPGGFSYGDDIASGRIFAVKVRDRLYPSLRRAAERGCAMIGACNGFQVLVQAGLLPGPDEGSPWPADAAPEPTLTLAENRAGRFVDDWVGVSVDAGTRCVWTRPLLALQDAPGAADIVRLPVAHGEGRLVGRDAGTIPDLAVRGQVALRYADNFNGSEDAVAGVCDPSGRIFGLMPHPERFLEWNRHPFWTRLPAGTTAQEAPGLAMFRAAVEAVAGASV